MLEALAPVLSIFTQRSLDILVVGGIVAFFFFVGLWFGKTRLTSLLLAFPLSAFSYTILADPAWLNVFGDAPKSAASARLLFFVLSAVLLSVLISRVAYAYSALSVTTRWFDLGLLSFGITALVLALYHTPLQLTPLYTFDSAIRSIFANPDYTFFIFLGALAVFFVAVRR